jgi:uncharacterized protein
VADELTIVLEDQGKDRGRWVARRGDDPLEAEMTFARQPGGLIVIDHTGVPPAWEGKGVGSALVKRMAADCTALGLKIVPRCSFIVAHIARNPALKALVAA